eukprot:1961020-Rhodomonas_salina.3
MTSGQVVHTKQEHCDVHVVGDPGRPGIHTPICVDAHGRVVAAVRSTCRFFSLTRALVDVGAVGPALDEANSAHALERAQRVYADLVRAFEAGVAGVGSRGALVDVARERADFVDVANLVRQRALAHLRALHVLWEASILTKALRHVGSIQARRERRCFTGVQSDRARSLLRIPGSHLDGVHKGCPAHDVVAICCQIRQQTSMRSLRHRVVLEERIQRGDVATRRGFQDGDLHARHPVVRHVGARRVCSILAEQDLPQEDLVCNPRRPGCKAARDVLRGWPAQAHRHRHRPGSLVAAVLAETGAVGSGRAEADGKSSGG